MSKEIIKSLILNTSTNKNNSTTFNLINPITVSEGYLVSQFTGVNSVFNINERNNVFSFTENSTILYAILPPGNYTITSLISALGPLISAASTVTYMVSVNSLTSKITISTAATQFRLVDSQNNIFYELGFTNFSTSLALSITANSTYDLSGLKMIYLVSSSFGMGNCISVNKNLNTICSIPITTSYLGIISYSSPNSVFISSQIDSIQSIDVQLYDERFRLLTLDRSFSITILFSQ